MIEAETMWALVEQRAQETPDAVLAVDERDRCVRFAEYRTKAERVASALHAEGVGEGSRVSWMLPTRIEAAVILAALARLGAVQNPILPIYRHKETRFVLEETRAELLIVPRMWRGFDYASMAASAAQGARVIVADLELPERDGDLPPERSTGDAARFIYYTSGTTSDPKGVKHTDRTLLFAAHALVGALALSPDDRAAIFFPMTHVGGALWVMASLMSGCTLITSETFDARAIELLRRHRVTQAGAGTFFHQAYVEAQRELGKERLFPELRACPGGGAPKPPKLHHDVKRELGGAGILSGYGLTECPVLTMNTPKSPDEKLAHTEGRASLSEAQIVIAEDGEVRAKAPQMFKGYVNSALDESAFDANGFFRTGDLGALDGDGYLTITGRLKDIIIRKGENISAKELEDHLYAHPKVRDVAVIGLPDPIVGERCCAVVVPRDPTSPLSFDEMIVFLSGLGMMKQKLPEQLENIAELPRNANGKVQKNTLRERYKR
jgi:acyl-CoA synthetase (AMP-forming)/AMP-acid ligase II